MAASTTAQQTIDVVTPSAGESVTDGTIVEISTDKVDVELPSPATGTVSEILVAEGDTVTVGQVIARIAVGGSDGARPAAPSTPGSEAGAPSNGSTAANAGAAPSAATSVSPVAARVAAAE